MHNFKYRVKLTPGTVKKGKAAKQAVELFCRGKESSSHESTLIKALTDPEVFPRRIITTSHSLANAIFIYLCYITY